MGASISNEEKRAVPNVPEKLVKNSSLYKSHSKEASKISVSPSLALHGYLSRGMHTWLHLEHLDTKPSCFKWLALVHLPIQALNPLALQTSRPAPETCAELKQFGWELYERTSPLLAMDMLPPTRIFYEDNANPVKMSAQMRVRRFCTANPVPQAQLPHQYPLAGLWNTVLLCQMCGAVCSQHCFLGSLFAILRPAWWDMRFLTRVQAAVP